MPHAEPADTQRLMALVVDGDAAFAATFAAQLQALGLETIIAASGEEALARFDGERPDLVFMGAPLPGGMDGLEAIRRIKARCGERWVPVVLVSPPAVDEAIADGLAAGADDHIEKPFRPAHLAARVRGLTGALQLRERLHIAAGVFEHIRDGVVITDAHQRIVEVNPAFTEITGYALEELLGRTPPIYGEGLTPQGVSEEMTRQVAEQGYWRGEVIGRRKDGRVYPEQVSIVAVKEAGAIRHYVGIVSRVNTHHEDVVTDLPGRRTLRHRLAQRLEAARRAGRKAAVVVLDIDRFKEVNEGLGFDTGDMLLRETARRLRACVRAGDEVFRTGADEFAIVPAEVSSDEAFEEMAERIPEVLGRPFRFGAEEVHAGASVGVAFFPDDAADAEVLLANAEHAMEKAKALGGGRVEYFVATRQREVRDRRRMVGDLRQALAEGRFELRYQPIVELATGCINKAEALLIWRHPERGLVSPAAFIPAAERTGLAKPIGEWVLAEAAAAARQIRAWSPDFQVSVNVSAVQLLDREFEPRELVQALQRAGVPGKAITLEFTESLLLHATDAVLARLGELREAGIQFAVDDFGTGYSSLSYLQHLPVDYLKIAEAFVRVPGEDRRRRALCEAIVTMGHALGLRVVAEGIETEEQRGRMLALKCDFGQGYLFGRPLKLEEMRPAFGAVVATS